MATQQQHEAWLADATTTYRAAKEALDAARAELATRIRHAAADDVRQTDIVRAIDHEWTREYLRQLCRDHQSS